MGLLGGGDKEGKAPSAEDFYTQAKGYYANYSKWTGEEKERLDKDSAAIRARYSAGGGRGDSTYMDKMLGAREDSYHEAMADLEGGEHGKFLTAYFNDVKSGLKSQVAGKSESQGPSHLQPADTRGRSQMGGAQYFENNIPQEVRDARGAADRAQTFNREHTQTTWVGNQQMTSMIPQVGGTMMDKQVAGQMEANKNTIALANSMMGEYNAKIDALTMDDLFGAEFGAADAGPNEEDKAIQRAQSGASGRQGGISEKQRSAWWG